MTNPATPLFAKFTKIARRDGELRVSYTPDLIRAAHIAELRTGASWQVCCARIEATAYYTNDMDDALDTAISMFEAALRNPSQLIAERDLPSHVALHGSSPEVRKEFENLLNTYHS